MITAEQARALKGRDVVDESGEKIGSIAAVYLDDATEQPSWVTVKTGWFGTSETFVPVDRASMVGEDLQVPYGKDKVKEAPRIAPDADLDPSEEQELYRYYGLEPDGLAGGPESGTATSSGETAETAGTPTDATNPTGATTDSEDEPGAMTRSEERVVVGTQPRQVARARLRKYVVTENETITVPVTKEKVVLETEPIADSTPGQGPEGQEGSAGEVVLTEEQPTVQKEAVPVERVRLGKETVTDEETVTEEVRKERIRTEGDIDR